MNYQLTAGDLKRFWKKILPCPETGCWNWNGSFTSDKGNGHQNPSFHIGTTESHNKVSARRIAYLICFGELPKVVGCSCKNSACVNPNHLTPEASRYAPVGKEFVKRRGAERVVLNERLVGRILSLRRQGWTYPKITAKLGVQPIVAMSVVKMAGYCQQGKLRVKKKPTVSPK